MKIFLRISKTPLGCVGSEDRQDLPFQLLPTAPKVSCHRQPRHRQHRPRVRQYVSEFAAFRTLDPGTVASCPFAPPLYKSPNMLPLLQSVDGPFLVGVPRLLFAFLFGITRRTGPVPETPVTAVSRTARVDPAPHDLLPPCEKAPR